jgi:hypothetical protein
LRVSRYTLLLARYPCKLPSIGSDSQRIPTISRPEVQA